MKIIWLGKALEKVEPQLVPRFKRELGQVFPQAEKIVIYDCFTGFSRRHAEKIVLGVEVSGRSLYHTHVVKLGSRAQVDSDYDGWNRCVRQRNIASRLLMSLQRRALPADRAAIIYEDAYRFFGSPEDGQGPESLETVIHWSVFDHKPFPQSIERVIRQIYADLARCFYRKATVDAAGAVRFYWDRVRNATPKWRAEEWRHDLRRDALWLLGGAPTDDAAHTATYLDPVDYVLWALAQREIPQTLVGMGHGDLHGRNVYVGVQRGEAEYPVVFDYGDMRERNVPVWDFVKLETELKVRLLAPLYDDPAPRNAILAASQSKANGTDVTALLDQPTAAVDARSLRAHQLQFAFGFERILGDLTARLHCLSSPEDDTPPGGRTIVGEPKADRALGLLLRIRQEAALLLGDGQPHRGGRQAWRDEYYFALAAYGLCTAKFDYKASESAFALVSAGVACAKLDLAGRQIQALLAAKGNSCGSGRGAPPAPTYLVPLVHAQRAWRQSRAVPHIRRVLESLRPCVRHFSHAMPIVQEYALLLTETGALNEALALLAPLNDLGRVFRDGKSLARIGRIFKDLGDRALRETPVPFARFADHPAWQWYEAAYKQYREAFSLSREYYPAINAATLGLLCGHRAEALELAQWVFAHCRGLEPSRLPRGERFWVLASQGEALLLMGRVEESAIYYRQARAMLTDADRGLASTAREQVVRLVWALGRKSRPALRAIAKARKRKSKSRVRGQS